MTVRQGDLAPDFEQDTYNGSIRFHEWIGRSWCLLFSTSELAAAGRLKAEWNRRGVKLVGLSAEAAAAGQGSDVNFPVIADTDRAVAALYGMTEPAVACLIDPHRRVRLMRTYAADRCDFDEMLRLLDGLQCDDRSS